MKAVRLYGIGELRVEQVPPPCPAQGEVLITMIAAGICGSDLHNYRTGKWIAHLPITPGHEFFGVVQAVGVGVEHVTPGDRVVVDSRVFCGTCPACRRGQPNLCTQLGFVGEVCDGGFAECVVLPAAQLLAVPPPVPLDAVPHAYEMLLAGQSSWLKTVVKP